MNSRLVRLQKIQGQIPINEPGGVDQVDSVTQFNKKVSFLDDICVTNVLNNPDTDINIESDEKILITSTSTTSPSIVVTGIGIAMNTTTGGHKIISDGSILLETSAVGTSSVRILTTDNTSGISLEAGSNAVRIINGDNGLWLKDGLSTFFQKLIIPSLAADISWILPDTQGGVDSQLTNDGSGNLSWESSGVGTSPDSTGVITGGLLCFIIGFVG